MIPDITVAALAGFLLPYSWLAGFLARWLPDLRFEWTDYLQMWEYREPDTRFWACFGAGLVLSVTADAWMAIRLIMV